MPQWVKVPSYSDNLSPVPIPHSVWRELAPKACPLAARHTNTAPCVYLYTQTAKKKTSCTFKEPL